MSYYYERIDAKKEEKSISKNITSLVHSSGFIQSIRPYEHTRLIEEFTETGKIFTTRNYEWADEIINGLSCRENRYRPIRPVKN